MTKYPLQFSRGLSPEELACLCEHAQRDHWISVLLKLWQPSGASAVNGLRLDLRNGYMNFYRRGQSVARVGVSGNRPWLEVHWKYALSERPMKKSPYVTMRDELQTRGNTTSKSFEPIILEWIKRVDGGVLEEKDGTVSDGYSGREKDLIELLLSNTKNDTVIDLEVGIPGLGKRIDLATIERSEDGQPCVFFGEVKHFQDGRMRKTLSNDESQPDLKVIKDQLDHYKSWLTENRAIVGQAYGCAARQMQQLWNASHTDIELPEILRQAAKYESLVVCEVPRLIVLSSKSEKIGAAYESWGPHRKILKNQHSKYPLIEMDAEADQMNLATPI